MFLYFGIVLSIFYLRHFSFRHFYFRHFSFRHFTFDIFPFDIIQEIQWSTCFDIFIFRYLYFSTFLFSTFLLSMFSPFDIFTYLHFYRSTFLLSTFFLSTLFISMFLSFDVFTVRHFYISTFLLSTFLLSIKVGWIDSFSSRFFSYAKYFCVLFTFKGEPHLVSLEDTVAKNKWKQYMTFVNNIRSNKRRRQQRITLHSLQLCSFHLRNYYSINTWDALCRVSKAQQNSFLSLFCIRLRFFYYTFYWYDGIESKK
jgi:hypothetical protein